MRRSPPKVASIWSRDLTESGIQMAAEAIMTTDTFPKGAIGQIEGRPAARSTSPASPRARA
jgi:N-acetylglutamate synthase/N-acetylornithine aminotransferase